MSNEQKKYLKVVGVLFMCYIKYYLFNFIYSLKFEKMKSMISTGVFIEDDGEDELCIDCIHKTDDGIHMSKLVNNSMRRVKRVMDSVHTIKKIDVWNVSKVLVKLDYHDLLSPIGFDMFKKVLRHIKDQRKHKLCSMEEKTRSEVMFRELVHKCYIFLLCNDKNPLSRDECGGIKKIYTDERIFDYIFWDLRDHIMGRTEEDYID